MFEIVVVRALVSTLVTSLSCRAGGVPIFGRTAPQALLIARGVIGGTAMTVRWKGGSWQKTPASRVCACRFGARRRRPIRLPPFLAAATKRWYGCRWQTR